MASKKPAAAKKAAPTPAPKVKAPAAPAYGKIEARVAGLERAVRVLATRLLAPNGGGDEHTAEAEALFAELFGSDEAAA